MSIGPIRIIHIIARLNIGGPAIHVITLCKEIIGGDYESLLVSGKVGLGEGDMEYMATEKDVEPVIISELGRELYLLDDLKSFLKLRRIIKRFKPHIVHTHTAKAGALGRLAVLSINWRNLFSERIRVVHTFHGHVLYGYFNKLKTFFFQQVERFLSLFTDRIVVISPIQKAEICNKYKIANERKVRLIALGFDLSVFTEDKESREWLREKYIPAGQKEFFLVGIVGRLTKIKNHQMFLEAIKHLKDAGKSKYFKFMVVGDGELKSILMEIAIKLGIHEDIIFCGWQKDMKAIYSALDAVALTSINEGTPFALIEAMALGRPVVATKVGGVPDLMGKVIHKDANDVMIAENGILVPPNSSQGLANGLLLLLENKEMSRRMVHRARNFVLANYSKEKMISNIKALYQKIVLN